MTPSLFRSNFANVSAFGNSSGVTLPSPFLSAHLKISSGVAPFGGPSARETGKGSARKIASRHAGRKESFFMGKCGGRQLEPWDDAQVAATARRESRAGGYA